MDQYIQVAQSPPITLRAHHHHPPNTSPPTAGSTHAAPGNGHTIHTPRTQGGLEAGGGGT